MKVFASYARTLLPGLAGLAGVIVLLVSSLFNEYRDANRHAQVEVENISRLLDEHALATVQKTDLLMRDVLGHVYPSDMRLARGANSTRAKELHTSLESHIKTAPELISALHLTNAKGEHIHSSVASLPHIDISDRYHFLRQRDDPNAGLVISPPVISRTTGKWTLILTRRINFEDGSFAGTITAILEPEYFQKFYRSFDMGSRGAVSLFDKELHLVARYPQSEKDMGKISNLYAQTYIDKGINHATYRTKSPLDGVDRIYSFRQVGDLPLFVFAGIAADDYLAGWRRHAWEYSIGLVILSLLVLSFGLRQRRAEAALLDSEQRYRILFDRNPMPMWVFEESSLRFMEVNDRAVEYYGFTREEFLHMTLRDIRPVEDIPDLDRAISISPDGNISGEWRHKKKDGTIISVAISAAPMKYGSTPARIALIQDITERKAFEQQSSQHHQHIRALINAASETSFLLACDGVVLAINDTALLRLQHTEAEVLGKNIFDLLPPELAATRRAIFLDVIKSRRSVTVEDERAGIKFLATYTPILDEAGEVVQVAVSGTDVTERRQLEALEQLLPAVNHKILEGAPLQEVLELVCQKTVEAFDLALAWSGEKMADGSVALLAASGPAQEYLSAMRKIGVRWDDTPLGHGLTGSAIRMGEAQHCRIDDARFSPWAKAATQQGIKSSIAVPLILRGKIYGTFVLYSWQEAQFESPTFRKRIEALTDKIRLAMEMAIEQEQVNLLSTAVSSASNAVMITDPRGCIEWVNPAFVLLSGYSSAELLGRTPSILKSGKHDAAYYQKLWRVILDGKVWSRDTTEKRKNGTFYTVQQTITPIVGENGKITHFVSVHEDVTAKIETQARIQYIASHDGLTGLPNRTLFFDRISQLFSLSKRNKTGMALMFIDLDGFKSVNDNLGHHIGDLLLIGVAERLLACVRDSDIVARLGGDEFTATLFDISGRENVVNIAEKILGELSRPFELEGQSVSIGASIGIATANPEWQISEDQLIESADSAMYEAKRAGKNCYRFASEP